MHSDDHNDEDQVSSSEGGAMMRICCWNLDMSGDQVNDREAQEEEEGGSRRTRRQTVKIYVREQTPKAKMNITIYSRNLDGQELIN